MTTQTLVTESTGSWLCSKTKMKRIEALFRKFCSCKHSATLFVLRESHPSAPRSRVRPLMISAHAQTNAPKHVTLHKNENTKLESIFEMRSQNVRNLCNRTDWVTPRRPHALIHVQRKSSEKRRKNKVRTYICG